MIKDRGNIKWTAMMLPEHVAMLRELKLSENKKSKPVIDEQQLEEMNNTIHLAITNKKIVNVTYFKDFDYKTINGIIQRFDLVLRSIRIITREENYVMIKLETIIAIEIIY